MRVLLALFYSSLFLLSASVAGSSATGDDLGSRTAGLLERGLLNPELALERRAALGSELEALALERRDPWLLYIVGTLHRLGHEGNESSPYARDVDKAREYLARAALKGHLSAMEKLAFVEFEAGNRFEANVWAQLFTHYSLELHDGGSGETAAPKASKVVAGILALVQQGFPKKEIPKLEERVGSMIGSYDQAIRSGAARMREAASRGPLHKLGADRCHASLAQLEASPARRQRLNVGKAEYYLAFGDDGSVRRIWLLDAWPDMRTERALRTCAGTYRLKSTEGLVVKDHVAYLPIVLVDPRLRMKDRGD